jgi:hypothetical protein
MMMDVDAVLCGWCTRLSECGHGVSFGTRSRRERRQGGGQKASAINVSHQELDLVSATAQ